MVLIGIDPYPECCRNAGSRKLLDPKIVPKQAISAGSVTMSFPSHSVESSDVCSPFCMPNAAHLDLSCIRIITVFLLTALSLSLHLFLLSSYLDISSFCHLIVTPLLCWHLFLLTSSLPLDSSFCWHLFPGHFCWHLFLLTSRSLESFPLTPSLDTWDTHQWPPWYQFDVAEHQDARPMAPAYRNETSLWPCNSRRASMAPAHGHTAIWALNWISSRQKAQKVLFWSVF